jgi:N-acetylmuramoyl-L-alanine amidase
MGRQRAIGSHTQHGHVIIALRRAGIIFLFAVSILLACAYRYPTRSEQNVPLPPEPPAARCERSAFRVVVDVGHTVKVPGADSARGVPEYDFNLHLAQDIDQALVDAGFDQTVLLITATSPPMGNFERAMKANRMRADLYIAIHHDSVPDNLIQTWQYEGKQNRFNDQYPGYAIFVSYENGDRAGSLLFGNLLGTALQARGLGFTPHYTLPLMGRYRRDLVDADAGVYRYDQLVVLQQTHMPAVLLEAGSIVNRREEVELASPERRALTSAAVAAAVEDFCAARARPKSPSRLVKRPATSNAAPAVR